MLPACRSGRVGRFSWELNSTLDQPGRASSRDPLAWAVTAIALAGFAASLVLWQAGGGEIDEPWAPQLGLRLQFSFDGIGALYALLATGIGAAVFAYATAYLPLHLAQRDRPARDRWRFWPWMALFAVSMVGLATAQDLVLLFVMFDLTAVCSYFLIGFDREERASRLAALSALLVTGIGAVGLLVGAVILYVELGTFSIPALAAELGGTGEASTTVTVALALIAVAALAKSAQVPLHFWLPRAMAAPTPVSAYLHSAAMVAAGVLVIARVHQLLEVSPVVLDGLLAVGLASIAVGGAISLTRDGFKQVLAYSTISQYGYVVALYGIGGPAAAGAAAFYVIAHALAKSALFLTAGSVTMATGVKVLSRSGGLLRRLPVLAAASAVAAATLSALPLTIGFFKDELFFHAAAGRSTALGIAAVAAAGLTFAYTWRFWAAIFLGPQREPGEPLRLPVALVAPIAVLAALALLGGFLVTPFAELAEDAAVATVGGPAPVVAAYHLDSRTENLMAIAAWGLGGLLLAGTALWRPAALALARAGERWGPNRIYERGLGGLNRVSDWMYSVELRDLRGRVAAVLVAGGVLVGLGFLATPTEGAFALGRVRGTDPLLIVVLALVVVAALVVIRAREYVSVVIALAVVGLGLATAYALWGAPDVTLVAVLVETVVTVAFLAIVAFVPRGERPSLPEREHPAAPRRARWRDPAIGAIAGLAAFLVIWASLSRPAATERVVDAQIRLTPEAHGKDVVTVILADFRGLDTMVEITVIAVAVFGVISLLRRGRAW